MTIATTFSLRQVATAAILLVYLLFATTTQARELMDRPNRIGIGEDTCKESNIDITQASSDPLPSGIPTFTLTIANICITGCDISNIHLHCGLFSSARLIDPNVFKRLKEDDCLVNGGNPLRNGESINFQYANSFKYPLSLSSMECQQA